MQGFEIRECTNPLCRMRYPLVDGQRFGLRCPVCRTETVPVLMQRYGEASGIERFPTRIELEGFLDNIRSAWNVGSILRSADGIGLKKLILTGLTPLPDNPKVMKTSLGAEQSVLWSYHRNGLEAAAALHSQGHCLIGLEVDPRSKSILEPIVIDQGRIQVLIVGNEITGVDPEILDLCEHIINVPMVGTKRSYNVAVAFGIAAFIFAFRSYLARM